MNRNASTSPRDIDTARAFSTSWLHLPEGSIYTADQVEDWLHPITSEDVAGRTVLELGCGNASILTHLVRWEPSEVTGVDLGNSVVSARENLEATGFTNWQIVQSDLTDFEPSEAFDVVLSIGVLHHLQDPRSGFEAVVANTRSGGRFHCWVYGFEGNRLVRAVVDPLRRILKPLPWWVKKYGIATPLSLPVFVYAKLVRALRLKSNRLGWLPLADYVVWLGRREVGFTRHVIFDQLVAPTTHYLSKAEIEGWLTTTEELRPEMSYVVSRNGNSWKFGGTRK